MPPEIFTGVCGGWHIFRLTPPSGKKLWHSTTLQNFGSSEPNAIWYSTVPESVRTVALDGSYGDGTVVELSPPAAEKSSEQYCLFNFNGLNGERPEAGLISDPAGNLTARLSLAGLAVRSMRQWRGVRTVAPLSGQTAWTETVLHEFGGHDGAHTYGGVIAMRRAIFTATQTQRHRQRRHDLRVDAADAGSTQWTRIVLHEFHGNDGEQPMAGLTMDEAGICTAPPSPVAKTRQAPYSA